MYLVQSILNGSALSKCVVFQYALGMHSGCSGACLFVLHNIRRQTFLLLQACMLNWHILTGLLFRLQADLAQKLLQERALARSKEELGLPVRPKREARLPLQLSEAQLECYRDVLARRFDVLADPKRPRHSAQRTSEMRALCAELRKVSSCDPASFGSHGNIMHGHRGSLRAYWQLQCKAARCCTCRCLPLVRSHE